MNVLFFVLLAFAGAIARALIGWLDSKEAFDVRKFGATVVRAAIAAAVWAIGAGLDGTQLTVPTALSAFVSGTALDITLNVIGTKLGNPQFPLPPTS